MFLVAQGPERPNVAVADNDNDYDYVESDMVTDWTSGGSCQFTRP